MNDAPRLHAQPETLWQRFTRRLIAVEEAMTATYDDIQDRRLDRIEAELARLRADLSQQQ